jgi:glycogen debranching enzyme
MLVGGGFMKARRNKSRTPDWVAAGVEETQEAPTVIKVGSEFYVLASALGSRRATRVLANGESFAVFEVGGDILESPFEALGFFHRDTRHLSRFELKIAGESPYYLNSYTSDENAELRINLTNPDLGVRGGRIELPRTAIQIQRNWVIVGASLLHKVVIHNYAHAPLRVMLDFIFAVDFADLFEVRGVKRSRRGETRQPEISAGNVVFSYLGMDGVERFTEIAFSTEPAALDAGRASFQLDLAPDEDWTLEVRVTGASENTSDDRYTHPPRFADALATRRAEIEKSARGWSGISASNELMGSLLHRSVADLTALIRYAPEGTFIMAGIPWFATLFGRDSLITAFFALPFNPAIAVGTLKTLAALQGTEVDPDREEQPGKIVHEIRFGEMAASGEIPFGRYYGSVDSTPLFLWLLGRYVSTTGDLALAAELWSNVERALEWIERWGDRDGDLYVEYCRDTPRGLANQGWKDSSDAISHADGTLARAPIALCEVQAYVYAAYTSISEIAERLGRDELASRLAERAAALKRAFARDFWLDRERTVALALDADKRPCRVMASNAAHCLSAGLLEADQAAALGERLLGDDMFSGWGVRTLSARERRYNPMGYHNGSVWPHDNAIAAFGLSRLKRRGAVQRILGSLLDAAVHFHSGSLPELFCGFPREERLGPVPYPVACHPQAWSAGSIFTIVQAMLGIEVFGFDQRLRISSPVMPAWLDWLRIENLRVGPAAAVSFTVRRTPKGAAIEVIEKRGHVDIEIRK